ncbi:MAG: hypothetical protein RLZZ444_2656, partial [Pseudomonadota bacterium]
MRALIRSSLVLLALAAPFAATSHAADGKRTIVTVKDADYFGFDLRTVQNVTLDECKAACIDDNACKAFTFNTKAGWCFLKSDFKTMNPFAGAVAGKVVVQAASAPDIGAPPTLAFLTEQQEVDATTFRQNLAVSLGYETLGIDGIKATAKEELNRGAIDRAIAAYQSGLTSSPDNLDLWTGLVEAANRVSDNYTINNQGMSAAINAYRLTRTAPDRARVLALMAKSMENNQYYRAGINAYKASLKLVDNGTVRAALDDLRLRQGFRVVGNTLDNDNSNPRACVQFSEQLVKAGVDYASYVLVDGTAPKAIEAKEAELCVEGLQHGQRYKISLREGLPSAVDEPLSAQVDLSIYVRDRTPSVRFTGDSFVLPSTARRGIPIVSINSSSAKLKLYRIGDRNIASVLANSQFLTQVDGYRASQIEDEQGQLVWQGSIDVGNELNKEVITSFPVDEALPERKPGVYVLTAVSSEEQGNYWDSKATQWFVVSDLGISTYAGTDGLNVFVRSLATAKPLANVTLQLLAKNNEILGTATTDANGRATFDAGLMRGTAAMTPAVITAANADKDYVFLDMTRAGFDLSDRGVTGRPAPGAVDVLTWTERGIYRPGETVHVSALARDIAGQAIEKLPLTFIFSRPDGVEERRMVSDGGSMGGHTLDLPIQTNAMRGTWTMRVHTDPNQTAIAEKTFMVDDFVPDRIEFDLATTSKDIASTEPAKVTVDGRFLYGAPAAGLDIEGDVVVKPTRTRESIPGYFFGLADEEAQEETRAAIAGLEPLDE